MSSNREIPQRIVVVAQDATSDRTITAPTTDSGQHFKYFDSVTSQLAGASSSVTLYGGGITSYYAQGDVTGDKVINPGSEGVLIADQSVLSECVLVTNPDADVTGGTETAATVFRGGVEITDDLTDIPTFDGIDIAANVLTDIDVNAANTEDELLVGDVIKIVAGTGGLIEFTVTERNLLLSAGYYEATESQSTAVIVAAGVPVYGRFTKVTVPSGSDLGDVTITYG